MKRKCGASRWEGTDKMEKNTDDSEQLRGFFPSTLNFVSPLFLFRSCQIHSFSLFTSFHLSDPGLALQILPHLEFLLPPCAAFHAASPLLFSSLQLRHIFSLMHSSLFLTFICCLHSCIYLSGSPPGGSMI